MLLHAHVAPTKPTRVVILGAHGFLARELGRLLEENRIDCHRVSSSEANLTEPSAAGVLSGILLAGDSVVMTAALTPDKGRDSATLVKNLLMAESVGSALRQARCAHFVYISSDAVYDGRSPLINEDSSCEPTDLYSVMHIAREKILTQACRSAEIPLAILRPCAIFGAGDTHNSYGPNRFARTALTQRKITLFGDGEELRDHIYVDDVTRIIGLCLKQGSTGLLNLASGKSVSFAAVASSICSEIGTDIAVERLPRSAPVTHRHFDTTELVKSFPGFEFTQIESGIQKMIKDLVPSRSVHGSAQ